MYDESPLHILAICSRPLIDDEGHPIALLDVTEERRRIEAGMARAGGAAHVHFLPEATAGEVHSALRDEWNVVHFTGHGTIDGSLLLEDGLGVAHALTKSEAARLFIGRQTPLVVLSACYSETVGRELHAAGIPAVVAVNARVPIADLAAIIFAAHFYAALARGWGVRRAFNDAQRAVSLDPKVGDSKPPQDWPGNNEEPWSQRFKLIGGGQSTVGSVGAREHRDAAAHPPFVSNLSPRSANFVGRASEIVEVVKAFDEAGSQRVCVYGSGGLGKTELAKAVARWYGERARVGAILWASASRAEGEYRLRDLASLLGIAARVFRLPVTAQSTFDEQKTVVREFLAAQRALVLLDNWETIELQHRRELWDFARSLPDTVRVLVTSRDVLPPRDVRNLELDALAPKDAVDLFLKTARNAGYFDRDLHLRSEEIAILHSICERLNGYPLAIEVVAGQTLTRTLDEVWADLERVPQSVLEGEDELTGEPHGVWTSLGLSYDVLSPREQALFQCMCIFLSPASEEDVAAIAISRESPRPVLDSLVKRSLVRAREDAYYLPPIVRDYAESKLIETGRNPKGGHEFAYNYFSQKGTPEDALTASDHLFELASRFQSRKAAELFINYVGQFYSGLIMHGYWAEARNKTEQWIAVARALGDRQQEARAFLELGDRYFEIAEFERATELHQASQSLFEEIKDESGKATALYRLARTAVQQGYISDPARLYRQSLQTFEELGEKYGIASSLDGLASLEARSSGNKEEAARLYRRSLQIYEELGDKYGVVLSLAELADIEYGQGNEEEAARLYRRSLELTRGLENKIALGEALRKLASLQFSQGNQDEVERLCRQSLKIKRELKDKNGVARIQEQLAALAEKKGDYYEAARLYRDNLQIQEELGDRSGVAETLHRLSALARQQSDESEAARLNRQSLKLQQELGSTSEIAFTLGRAGQLYRAQGRMKEALDCALRSLAICEELYLPSREVALMDIEKVRDAVGAEHLREWLTELSTEGERISRWLEWRAAGNQTWTRDFVDQLLTALPEVVVSARLQASSVEQSELERQLTQLEVGAQVQDQTELADYLWVLRGLLVGDDVSNKIATLISPLKEIAEEAQAACA
jgi:predicted ATPase